MNDHLFLDMRLRDENKQEAIFEAAIKLINETGFVSASVAKIAAEAKVSPATLYIYYKNKEDLITSMYLQIKEKLSKAMLFNYNPQSSLKEKLQIIWLNAFNFISDNPAYFQFTEQFAHSPYANLIDKSVVEKHFEVFMKDLQKGIEDKIIKNVDIHILLTYAFYPVIILSNPQLCYGFEKSDNNLITAFELAWDAIKY